MTARPPNQPRQSIPATWQAREAEGRKAHDLIIEKARNKTEKRHRIYNLSLRPSGAIMRTGWKNAHGLSTYRGRAVNTRVYWPTQVMFSSLEFPEHTSSFLAKSAGDSILGHLSNTVPLFAGLEVLNSGEHFELDLREAALLVYEDQISACVIVTDNKNFHEPRILEIVLPDKEFVLKQMYKGYTLRLSNIKVVCAYYFEDIDEDELSNITGVRCCGQMYRKPIIAVSSVKISRGRRKIEL